MVTGGQMLNATDNKQSIKILKYESVISNIAVSNDKISWVKRKTSRLKIKKENLNFKIAKVVH